MVLGIHLNRIEKALLWIEKSFVKQPDRNMGYWENNLKNDNRAAGLLCSYTLLKSEEMGRKLIIINRVTLIETAKKYIDYFINHLKDRQDWIWALHICALLANLNCFNGKYKNKIKNDTEYIIKNTNIKHDILFNAQAILGLIFHKEVKIELIIPLINNIELHSKKSSGTIFWSHELGSEFTITRYVIWSLEECWSKNIIRNENIKQLIQGGILWILKQQDEKGYWLRNSEREFEVSYCGYAALNIWKHIKSTHSCSCNVNECLQNIIELLIEPYNDTSIANHTELESNNKKNKYYIGTICILSVVLITDIIINYFNKIISFILEYERLFGLLSTYITIIGSASGIIAFIKKLKQKF